MAKRKKRVREPRPADEAKRQRVRDILANPRWSDWSGRAIARKAGVSCALVAAVRAELEAAARGHPRRYSCRETPRATGRRLVLRGGVLYDMQVDRIGEVEEEDD
jgi:hypothetical protein